MDGGKLDVRWQAGAETVDIDTPDISLFRFEEQLVPVAVAKTVDFIFDTRAVARALAVNTTAEHRAILEATAQNIVRLDVRASNPANAIVAYKPVNLVTPELVGSCTVKMAVAHRPRMLVAMLHVAFVKVDRIWIQAARRACF